MLHFVTHASTNHFRKRTAPRRDAVRRTALLLLAVSVALATQPANAREPDIKLVTRTPAPTLEGGVEWLNTSGPLDLRQLRGKLVILDFWTYCCINCIHILPELKKLEEAYPNEVVVIGVHSPKFATERSSENIREAILRHKIVHPVVNDAGQVLWRKFGVQVWPSLRIIDPQGYLIATHVGEASFEQLDRFVRRTLATYRRRSAVDPTPLRFDLELDRHKPMPLRFPGKVLADKSSDRLFISDHGHHRIVVTRKDGTLIDVIGSGEQGQNDGEYSTAQFDYPQGMALVGDDLYVADTENHCIRKVDLKAKRVSTVAGTGERATQTVVRLAGVPKRTLLSSPWALTVSGNRLFIAMAGKHQIWCMTLDGRRIFPFAGSGKEDIIDGNLLPTRPAQPGFAAFAQPTGITSDDKWLYVADSEGASIRAVPIGRREPVRTVVGTARLPADRLFTFGDLDGPLGAALLQHPMGIVEHDRKLFITDTYNNKIKILDLDAGTVKTLVGHQLPGDSDDPPRFNEPTGVSIANSTLFVADTNNHAIRSVDLNSGQVTTLSIKGLGGSEA